MSERVPAEVFPPGEYLQDELEKRDWSQVEFAEIIGRPASFVSDIITGRRGVSPEAAKEIGAALGTSPHYWLNLEAAYRLGTEPAPRRITQNALLRTRFPMTREMVKRGWIKKADTPEELEANVLRFYRIANPNDKRALAHAAKRNDVVAELTPQQEAWLYRVRQIAETMPMPAKYSEHRLRSKLDELHTLTVAPEEARHVPGLLAECGVRFVVVEPLPASKIDGVCLWLSKAEPVIGMSLRHNRIDNFWFVLRHEVEHVLNSDGKSAAIVDSDMEGSDEANGAIAEQERRANTAAREFCIPPAKFEMFFLGKNPIFSKSDVVSLARDVGVHPGIVAGQLRKRLNRWDIFTGMLAAVRDIVAPGAITDGYGFTLPELR